MTERVDRSQEQGDLLTGMRMRPSRAFFIGLALVCGGTLMYEVVLTRILSVLCWYYLAFVSISMAMFGMTAGALFVQVRPDRFRREEIPHRLAQITFAMAVSMPVALVTLFAVPLGVSRSLETFFGFLLFSSIIAVPFFFSGVAVCISLTRTPFDIGHIYFADLFGAGAGCLGAVVLLELIDAPSGIFVISSFLFLGAAAYATYSGNYKNSWRCYMGAAAMLIVAVLNASTRYGIQPIWSKGEIDPRADIAVEVWNPISKVRVLNPRMTQAPLWGPSPRAPQMQIEAIHLDIDNDATTWMLHFRGDLKPFDVLLYDVTSLGAQMRAGGAAAIIGVGGGRDVLICAINGFSRIVGIEVNSAIINVDTRRFAWFSGFDIIPGFELHADEGRSYLTRNHEKFDLIQASLVDTWAATSAGAMTLSENSLYTVDAWQVFYRDLKPGGLITFSRWYREAGTETYRLFSTAWATLLSEGVADPSRNIALVSSDTIATILVSNQPFSEEDLRKIRSITDQMKFTVLFFPGEPSQIPELSSITSTRTLAELERLRYAADLDYSPVFDSSPYFFSTLRLRNLPHVFKHFQSRSSNFQALFFLFALMVAAIAMVIFAIVFPLIWWARRRTVPKAPLAGGIAYFIVIGLGFILVEMAMMQQLSIFLGHPIYSLVVVLAVLILSTGIGSLVSDRLPLSSSVESRMPALVVSLALLLYSAAVMPVIHGFVADVLWQRVLLSLALVAPCGFLMGFCFPVGLRWLTQLKQEDNLPWMWALNGAAATLGSFVAILISMETTITTCVLTGAACYLVAAAVLPSSRAVATAPKRSDTVALSSR
jgi:SAM-dependent methyltransferase